MWPFFKKIKKDVIFSAFQRFILNSLPLRLFKSISVCLNTFKKIKMKYKVLVTTESNKTYNNSIEEKNLDFLPDNNTLIKVKLFT